MADDQQLSLVRHYLETHRAELLDSKFERALIRGADAEAARKMFNHAKTLTTTDARLRQVASESRSTSQLDDTTLERVDARTTHRGR